MPIYAFRCAACGHEFDRLQRLSDADPTQCPECGDGPVGRQLTAPQFRLAGAGWYETDFKKDGDKKRNLAGDGGDKSEGKSGDGKSADGKSSDGKSGDGKGKSGDGKPADKGSDSKPASKPAESKPAAPAKSDSTPSK